MQTQIICIDHSNDITDTIGPFIDYAQAVAHLTKELGSQIDEHNGKLYYHWIDDDDTEREYTDYTTLFDYKETPNAPKTMPDLIEYLTCGNALTVNWSDRAPVTYQITAV